MGTFLHVLSEQYRTEHFFGAESSVLTEHLDPMFPRTLSQMNKKVAFFENFFPMVFQFLSICAYVYNDLCECHLVV